MGFKKIFLDIDQTSLPHYLLCIVISNRNVNVFGCITRKGLMQTFFSISAPSDKMLFGNVVGSHCCFELA